MRKPIARNLAFRLVRVWITACALLFLTTASAYDVTTHAAMTSEAVAASQITRDPNASVILKRLGIVDFSITSDLLDGTKQIFMIYLMRGEDGIWRIESL
jgi:hypothetical protein